MRITVVGSGDAFGSGGRYNTCLHLQHAGGTMLVDCGATSLIALQRAGIDCNAISTILVTHFHGDHFAGIPFFLLHAQFIGKRTAPLVIAGPAGVETRTRALMEVTYPGILDAPRAFSIRYEEITPQMPAAWHGAQVRAFPVVHDQKAGPCQGYRIAANGKLFAFSGDTAWTDALVPLADGADALLLECYSRDLKLANHLDWNTIAAKRASLRAERIILTHMGPQMLAYDEPLPVERAHDGFVIDL